MQIEGIRIEAALDAEAHRLGDGQDRAAAVRRARSRNGKIAERAIGVVPEGIIIALLGIFWAESAHKRARRIRTIQPEEFPAIRQPETGVEPIGRPWIRTIFPGGKNYKVAAR